jgi:hypothetical protein
MTKKGTVAPHPVCENSDHPKDKLPKMIRLYKRLDKKFIPCAWMCPQCERVQRD